MNRWIRVSEDELGKIYRKEKNMDNEGQLIIMRKVENGWIRVDDDSFHHSYDWTQIGEGDVFEVTASEIRKITPASTDELGK